jgi:adenylate kinase
MHMDAVIFLEVPEQELIRRIKDRAKIAGRADDQDEAKIATRMRVYHDETLPVAAYYAQQNKLFKVCGVGTVDAIFDRIVATMGKLPAMPTLK